MPEDHRDDTRMLTHEMDSILGISTDLDSALDLLSGNMDSPSFPDYLAQRMEEETFLFCVSEFPLRKAIAVRQGG